MNVANESNRAAGATGGRFQNTYNHARESAADALSYGENCVRQHPEAAVWSSFTLGLLVGALAGWALAEHNHDHGRSDLRRLIDRLQKQLHF